MSGIKCHNNENYQTAPALWQLASLADCILEVKPPKEIVFNKRFGIMTEADDLDDIKADVVHPPAPGDVKTDTARPPTPDKTPLIVDEEQDDKEVDGNAPFFAAD